MFSQLVVVKDMDAFLKAGAPVALAAAAGQRPNMSTNTVSLRRRPFPVIFR
jgi:hypothetical protein